jgi:hypothetical protein
MMTMKNHKKRNEIEGRTYHIRFVFVRNKSIIYEAYTRAHIHKHILYEFVIYTNVRNIHIFFNMLVEY